jgi:predicted dehydrogenase
MTLRIGVLGAARITPMALMAPALTTSGITIAALAARDATRAQLFAAKHGIETAHASYEALLDDATIDAIYNPLPNSLHAPWTLRAIAAGKHVLCEKPLTSNAREAEQVNVAAHASGLVVMEAFHWRHHPLAQRIVDVITAGRIGRVRHVEIWACIPLPLPGDIRYRLDLAGGAMMDIGSYAVNMLRTFAGQEPRVLSARAKLSSPGVDRAMDAELSFEDGATGRIHASLFSHRLFALKGRIEGTAGSIDVFNPLAPQFYHSLTIRDAQGKHREKVNGRTSYAHQLEAFRDAVVSKGPVLTSTDDAVKNMRVIDAIYGAAGLEPRPSAPRPSKVAPLSRSESSQARAG